MSMVNGRRFLLPSAPPQVVGHPERNHPCTERCEYEPCQCTYQINVTYGNMVQMTLINHVTRKWILMIYEHLNTIITIEHLQNSQHMFKFCSVKVDKCMQCLAVFSCTWWRYPSLCSPCPLAWPPLPRHEGGLS